MLRLHHERSKYPRPVSTFFDLDEHDPYFSEDVNGLLYGEAWESVLIEDGNNALVHAYACSPISSTGLYDVEPLMGYSGMLANTTQAEFLQAALAEYSAFCRHRGVVAELLRFSPMMRNHEPLDGLFGGLRLTEQKPIAYIRLSTDHEAMLATYARDCRTKVRKGLRRYEHRELLKSSPEWDLFVAMYRRSMQALGANPAWLFDSAFFERLRNSPRCLLLGTFAGDAPLTLSTFLLGRKTGYFFLCCNNYDVQSRAGASNSNMHFAAIEVRRHGCDWLCLGGGNSEDRQDPLMRFKMSLAREIRPLPLGFFCHNQEKLDELYAQADSESPEAASSRLFLRYRLAPSFRAGRMKTVVSGEPGVS